LFLITEEINLFTKITTVILQGGTIFFFILGSGTKQSSHGSGCNNLLHITVPDEIITV